MVSAPRQPVRGTEPNVQGDGREKVERVEPCHGYSGEQGGQSGVGSRQETLEGGHGGRRGLGGRGGRENQATNVRQAVGNQRDDAGARGWGRGGVNYCEGYQRGRGRHRARRVHRPARPGAGTAGPRRRSAGRGRGGWGCSPRCRAGPRRPPRRSRPGSSSPSRRYATAGPRPSAPAGIRRPHRRSTR